jgi:hypothetical protein
VPGEPRPPSSPEGEPASEASSPKKRSLPVFKDRQAPAITPERLFRELFSPLYPPDVDLALVRDTDANPAKNPQIFAALDETAALFAKLAPEALGRPDLAIGVDDEAVHRLSPLLTREARDRMLEETGKGPPLLVHFVTHASVFLGACIVKHHGGEWLVRSPLWESRVRLSSRAGVADIAPFSWWLKALSDDEIGRSTLADRYRTFVEVPTFDAEKLEVIAAADRRLPRLAKVRYDLLYKHLKAHLPELRSVGDHFPSPERFEELGFTSLEFLLVGGGRMLVMHGPTKTGVHLFFLTREGFSKAVYIEARAPFSHEVAATGDKLRVTVKGEGAPLVHETLWWGA